MRVLGAGSWGSAVSDVADAGSGSGVFGEDLALQVGDDDVVVIYKSSILCDSCTICKQFSHINAFFTLKILKALSCIFSFTNILIAEITKKSVINFVYFIVNF